jgi:eukaryotic-like serine/threonine-protein kinase
MAANRLTISVDERTRLAKTRLGTRVGKWRLDRLIGVGGMAAVFEAVHTNGNRVAIKILHPDLAGFDEIRERFLSEGYVANRVSHPGVVTVRDEGTTEDGAVYLVMDLLRGQTLAERLEDGVDLLSVGEVLEIAAQLLDVLVYAHGRGIVHRDIKPENVFLTNDGRVRLLDFGIARVETRARTHTTEAGTTLGTPAFMPPEQALGRWAELDGRSDLWSLGATMYLLLSGTPVREHGSVTEQLLGAMTRPVPSLGDVMALPRSVVAVVDRALAFDRDDRFPDARSMQLAVRAAQGELSTPDARATLPPPSVEPMALSLRTPRPEGRYKRPSIPTVRPVASNPTPLPLRRREPAPSRLPFVVSLGFAVGLSIVIAARLTAQAPEPIAAPAPAAAEPPAHSSSPAPGAEPLVPPTSAVPPASASSAPLRKPVVQRNKPPSDPLSRRK